MGPRLRGDDIENVSGLLHAFRPDFACSHRASVRQHAHVISYFISSFASAMYIGSETGSLAALAAIGCEA